MSMFSNAHHFNVERIEVHGQNADALKDLSHNIAVGALLNSDKRSDAPTCHPETRVAVQQEIFSWVPTNAGKDEDASSILWLTGPAGSGKTTIMNTIGEQLKKDDNLAAAFFFSSFSGSSEVSSKWGFVTTIAYQLIQHDCFQCIREHVLSSIAKDPTIFRMHLKEQMEVLILRPLRLCKTHCCDAAAPPQVILVDGVDECGKDSGDGAGPSKPQLTWEQDQREVLDVLAAALDDPAFPFCIVVASRPEPAIRHFFQTTMAKYRPAEIFLDYKYNPDADIALYLRSNFARIRRRCPHLPPSWPDESTIATFVENASQQMIYAATVIRFIETPLKAPEVQLETILEAHRSASKSSSTLNPFGPLDALYAQILNSSPEPALAIKWFKAYCYLDIEEGFPAWCLNRLCETHDGEAEHLFANLPALVRISDQSDVELARYTFYHKSFLDFLFHDTRYGAFFTLSEEEVRRWLIERFIEAFNRRRPVRAYGNDIEDRFSAEILKLWYLLISERKAFTEFYDQQLLNCDAIWWISRANLRDQGARAFTMLMFVVSHNQCWPFKPCTPTCKLWRTLILNRWKHTSRDSLYINLPGRIALFLDRFGLKRIPLRSTGFGVTVFHHRTLFPSPEDESEGYSSLWSTVPPSETRIVAMAGSTPWCPARQDPPVVAPSTISSSLGSAPSSGLQDASDWPAMPPFSPLDNQMLPPPFNSKYGLPMDRTASLNGSNGGGEHHDDPCTWIDRSTSESHLPPALGSPPAAQFSPPPSPIQSHSSQSDIDSRSKRLPKRRMFSLLAERRASTLIVAPRDPYSAAEDRSVFEGHETSPSREVGSSSSIVAPDLAVSGKESGRRKRTRPRRRMFSVARGPSPLDLVESDGEDAEIVNPESGGGEPSSSRVVSRFSKKATLAKRNEESGKLVRRSSSRALRRSSSAATQGSAGTGRSSSRAMRRSSSADTMNSVATGHSGMFGDN